jgi:hypothetical protein
MLQGEETDIQRMEQNERKRLDDFEKLKITMREKKKNKQLAHRKIVSRQIAKNYLNGIKGNAIRKLKDMGYFADQFQVEILDGDVVPWLYEEAFRHLQELSVQQALPTNLALDHLVQQE